MSVIKLIISLKNIKYVNDINNEVKKLNCIEFLTVRSKVLLFFLPIAKPTTPSVEKA